VAGQAEVQQRHIFRAAMTQEEVGGFEIAVNDAVLMGQGEGLSGIAQQGEAFLEIQGLA
jgi:hypothetical protein